MVSAPSFSLNARAGRLIAAVGATLALMGADRAQAGVLVASASDCDKQVLKHPFLPWADPAAYTLVTDGSFAVGARSWQLSGASVVDENEPFRVSGDHRPASLRVDAGGSATSAPMCVGIEHPTLRFLARNDGPLTSTLAVEALFEDEFGHVRSVLLGEISGHSTWAPTLPLPVVANLLPLLPDERTPVAFRFSTSGSSGGWLIDGVYVDPYSKG
jgi:hypothetical protein